MGTAVLALQGAFIEHEQKLEELGEPFFEIREEADLKRHFDRLILPGGESTVQGRLLRKEGLLDPLRERIEDGMPVLATCAGLILLARNIEDDVEDGTDRSAARPERHFDTLDATVQRNAYGRQLGSFRTEAEFKGLGKIGMTFIRAPYIKNAGPEVEVLAEVDGRIVAVRQGAQLGLAFHPELEESLAVHEMFLAL